MQTAPSDAELLLLRSIEWTTFMESTYNTALEQANVILRYFLGKHCATRKISQVTKRPRSFLVASGRVLVARSLLGMLPPELMTISEPDESATEYLHYRQFFDIWETIDRVVDCQSLEVQKMTKETTSAWLKDFEVRAGMLFMIPYIY
jgi:nuclear pore complex protein Nup107